MIFHFKNLIRIKLYLLTILVILFVTPVGFINKVNAQEKQDQNFFNGNIAGHEVHNENFSYKFSYELKELTDNFIIKFTKPLNLEQIAIRAELDNGTYSQMYNILDSHMIEETQESKFFLFNKPVKNILFYTSDVVELNAYDLEIIDFNAKIPVLNIQPFSMDMEKLKNAQIEYKERLYELLNLDIVLREEWGGQIISNSEPLITSPKQFVIHHTATSVNESDPKVTVQRIYEYHRKLCWTGATYNAFDPNCDEQDELWGDIGYNYLIAPNGEIFEGRAGGMGTVGMHSVPNSDTIGIAILGDYTNQEPTDESLIALEKLIGTLSAFYDIDIEETDSILGHNERSNTICPGKILDKLSIIRTNANNIKEDLTSLSEIKYNLSEDIPSESLFEINNTNQVIIDKGNVSNEFKTRLESGLVSEVNSYIEMEDSYVLFVNKDIFYDKLAEYQLLESGAKPQANFKYFLYEWDIDENGVLPSDYNENTHWYLDKTDMRKAWDVLGGCENDELCGGNNDVTIAIIDTGLAYETYKFDAGSEYNDDPPVKVGSFYFDIPTDSPDGETYDSTLGRFQGYERDYYRANFLRNFDTTRVIDPFDAAQEFFCDYRETEEDGLYSCSDEELEKINHANDDIGHGTAVASIIFADPDDGDDTIGMAHNTSVMPIKAFSPNDNSFCQTNTGDWDEDCSNSDGDFRSLSNSVILTAAINHAVDNNADIINMSLGSVRGESVDTFFTEAVENAIDAGIVIVAAAGNDDAPIGNTFPAGIADVITVGATDLSDNKANYSNFGAKLDIMAPVGESGERTGVLVTTFNCFFDSSNTCSDEQNEDIYNTFVEDEVLGTSFAAPQVTAIVAQMLSIDSTLLPQDIESILQNTALDIGSDGRDTLTGYGLLNSAAAINEVIPESNVLNAYRFFNLKNGAHLYTISAIERDTVLTLEDEWLYEGTKFKVYEQDAEDLVQVHRFFNKETGAHLYTISDIEKETIETTLSQYVYEGIKFYVREDSFDDSLTTYRFFNVDNGAHLYTTDEVEKTNVAKLENFNFEGVVFYVE